MMDLPYLSKSCSKADKYVIAAYRGGQGAVTKANLLELSVRRISGKFDSGCQKGPT
jgi:hypothetical protein